MKHLYNIYAAIKWIIYGNNIYVNEHIVCEYHDIEYSIFGC